MTLPLLDTIASLDDLRSRMRSLSDVALEHLRQELQPAPRVDDMLDVVQAEQSERCQTQQNEINTRIEALAQMTTAELHLQAASLPDAEPPITHSERQAHTET